jgi:hypothetical protein
MRFGEKSNDTCAIINNEEFPNLASKFSSPNIQQSRFPDYGHKYDVTNVAYNKWEHIVWREQCAG